MSAVRSSTDRRTPEAESSITWRNMEGAGLTENGVLLAEPSPHQGPSAPPECAYVLSLASAWTQRLVATWS